MSINSVFQQHGTTLKDIARALGETHFSGAASDEWAFVFNGLIFQGGKVTVAAGGLVTVTLQAPYSKQILGIFIQMIAAAPALSSIDSPALDSFDIQNSLGADRDFYWWSVGV